ncbi:MAG: VanW family protein [Oscillospiraceae bacterium]|nr:VanW family protein [Oscillospiraceae bacterium]
MSNGKFSQPRNIQDEDRQIEEAFRQVTQKNNPKKRTITPVVSTFPPEDAFSLEETIMLTPEQKEQRDAALQNQIQLEPPIEELISREIENTYPDADYPSLSGQTASGDDEYPDEEWETDEEEPEGGLLDQMASFFLKGRSGILIAVFCVALAMIGGLVAVLVNGIRTNPEDLILDNVIVAGVNVGGMTRNEAVNAVKQATSRTYSKQDMVVSIDGHEIRLSPKDTGITLDVKAAVNAAYEYGRIGTPAEQEFARQNALTYEHTISLLPYLQLDKDYILQTLKDYSSGSGSSLTQASYGLEGKYPSLQVDSFDPNSAQTLVLTMGTPGIGFDAEQVYAQILDAYSLNIFHVTVTEFSPAVEPDPVDLNAIYTEFYVAPVDSRINMQTYQVIPGSYGYEFDLEAAQKQVDAAQYGQVLRIPMIFIEPKLIDKDILFRDVMAESVTALSNLDNHARNIQLACQAINGTVLQPGDTFSFHQVVGQPTAGKGYKNGPVYVGTEQTEAMGGGISQVSSVLYYCAMLSDLEILSRTAHSFPVSYLDYGMDADVVWGGADLQIRNSTLYPIRIEALVSGGELRVRFIGTDDRDYFIKVDYEITNVYKPDTDYVDFSYDNAGGLNDGDVIQEGVAGYTVKSYRLKYSRSTGKLLSKDYETTTRYSSINRIVARVAPPENTVPETTVPETVIPETTVPEDVVPKFTEPEYTDAAA